MATSITLVKGDTVISVEIPHDNPDYIEFMSMIEVFINSSSYSKHEIESYIKEWAADLRRSEEN